MLGGIAVESVFADMEPPLYTWPAHFMATPLLGKLALAMHPDKPGGSKTAFQETVQFSDEDSDQLWSTRSF